MKNTISKGWLSLLIVMGILILDQIEQRHRNAGIGIRSIPSISRRV
jgi:hypothetical protein